MRFWIDVWTILGPSWGPCGVPFGLRDATGTPPRRSKTLSRRSQDAPKMLPRRSRTPIRHPKRPQEGPTHLQARNFIDFRWFVIDVLLNCHRFSTGLPVFFSRFFGLFSKYSRSILAIFWDYSWNTLIVFWEYSGRILGLFCKCSGNFLGLFWEYSGSILRFLWQYFRIILEVFWDFSGGILGLFLKHSGNILKIFW